MAKKIAKKAKVKRKTVRKKTGKRTSVKKAARLGAKAKSKPSKRGKRYNAKRKEALLAKYRGLRKGGMNAQKAAKVVRVSYLTLRKWEKESGLPKLGRKAAGKKVAKKRAAKRGRPRKIGRQKKARSSTISIQKGRLVLVSPAGFRIEGISTRELIQVLKALK